MEPVRAPSSGLPQIGAVPMTPTAPAESPFVRARREWDDRYMRQSRAIRNWQIATLASMAMAAGFAAGLLRLAGQSRITPYVVEVDRHGAAVAFGPAERLAEPDERVVRYLLAEFLANVRTVTADDELQRHLIARAYDYSRGEATTFLNAYYRRTNPFEAALRKTRRVQVSSLLPVGERTWRAQWTETSTSLLGRTAEEAPWQAVLVLERQPPRTTDTLLTNPLGLYVTEIAWQQMPAEGGTSP